MNTPSFNQMDWPNILKGMPFLTKDQVVGLVKEWYECEVTKIKDLRGYNNQIFLVEVLPLRQGKNHLEAHELTTNTYVLKVKNSLLSKGSHSIDVARMMEFLSSKGFCCSQPVPTKNGDLCQLLIFKNLALRSSEKGESGNQNLEDTFIVRMETYLSGTVWSALPLLRDNVFEEIGRTLAQMHIALQELDIDKRALQDMGEHFPWSLDGLHKSRQFLFLVEDLEKRQLVEDVMNEFDAIVVNKKEELPQGFLHGDFNDDNIIVDVQEGSHESHFLLPLVGFLHGDFNDGNIIVDVQEGSQQSHFLGFIDFDNACYSCTVYDIAIPLMYVLQSKTLSMDSAARSFLQGYSKYRKIIEVEKDCLFYCIAGRFVQSLLGGLYHYSMSKHECYLSTQHRGWDALKAIWTSGKEETYQKWNFS